MTKYARYFWNLREKKYAVLLEKNFPGASESEFKTRMKRVLNIERAYRRYKGKPQ